MSHKPGCTAEPQRSQREMFLLLQSGDPPSLKFRRASSVYMRLFNPGPRIGSPAGALAQAGGDWSRNSAPSGIRSNPITALALIVSLLTEKQKPSCLSISPDKQEIVSLRPQRLCGENSILDEHHVS